MTERQATIAFLITASVLLGVLAQQVRRDDGGSALAHIVRMATAPVVHGVLGGAHRVRDGWRGYVALIGARRENEEARRRIARLEAERSRYLELLEENRRLRELLDLSAPEAFPGGVVGRVIGDLTSGPLRRRVLVGRGVRDGVREGWVATVHGAVAGRVVEAGSRSCDVMLIVDPDSGVAVRHELDRFSGVLRGGNRGPARLEYVPRDHPVAVGDPLVTSGLDGLYPPGLLVGHVRELFDDSPLTWTIAVEVAFDPGALEELLLIPPLGPLPLGTDGNPS
ncbi:MAG: rod shape-determining protein MreC [Acidobacteriota bacterium]|nr:rod shape-determining protein MreC [Acidobacteriota bacterium]